MNGQHRKRHSLVPGADLLESRALLNADLPHAPIAHVASLHAEATTKPIKGNWTYTSQTIQPGSLGDATFTESASGSSSVGSVSLRDSYVLHQVTYKPNVLSKQTLLNGTGTLTLGDGSTLDVKFSGTRQANLRVFPPRATYSLKGTATVESGPNQGHVYKLTATSSAPTTSQFITYRFTLK